MMRVLTFTLTGFLIAGCGSLQQFVAVPSSIDLEKVPRQTTEIMAQRYTYTPDEIHVKVGTLVTLKVTAMDGTHGFKLAAFGLDEKLEQHVTKVIEFYAGAKGEYDFQCSHFCGIGHFGMSGKVIVD